MVRKHNAFIGIVCSVLGIVGGSPIAWAETPLTHADIQQIRNQVDFIPDSGSTRSAQLSDRLDPGDALSTHQSSFAELEFNDGSLARVGELVLFRFQPNTRTFELDNGTLLLLIPPNQGTSRLRTPNASAGIRGSGLFVRYIEGETPAQSVTLVGALTTSGITVANTVEDLVWDSQGNSFTGADESASDVTAVELEAGHMAVIVGDAPPQVFSFDIEVFYQTSTLVSGLDLDGDGDPSIGRWQEDSNDGEHLLATPSSSDNGEQDAIALVREETKDGLFAQSGTLTTPYIDNPPFVYGGNWQPNTAWVPTSPQAGLNYTDTIDSLIDSADIQTPQSYFESMPPGVRGPMTPVAPPRAVGPLPMVGPNPGRGVDVPTPPVGPNLPVGPEPIPPTIVAPPPDPVNPSPAIPDPVVPDSGIPDVPPTPPAPTPVEPPINTPPPTPPPPPTPTPTPPPTQTPLPTPTPPPTPTPVPTPTPAPNPFEGPIDVPSQQPARSAEPGSDAGPVMGPSIDTPFAPDNEAPGDNVDDGSSPQPTFDPPQSNDGPTDIDDMDNGDDPPILEIFEPGAVVGPQ